MIPEFESFFSGGGLLDEGLRQSGVQIKCSYELDPVCCEVARANSEHAIVQCNIEQKLALDDCHAHAAAFTYPCNRYSGIAAIHGMRVGDALFLHAFRHIVLKRYELFWIENVPGMLKFAVVMEALSKLPGYYVTTFCPVETEIWLPQHRDRLILVGSRRPFQWNKPVSRRRISLKEILEKDPRVEIPKYVAKRLKGKYRDLPIISDPSRGDIAPTCVAHYSKDLSTRLVVDRRFKHGVRPYSVREYARLQGLPDSFQFPCSDRAAYKMIGNGVSVPVGRWIGRETRRYFNSN